MASERRAVQEGVIVVFEDGEPSVMARRNGEVVYYKLTKMSFGEHAEFLGADLAHGTDGK